MLMILCSAVSPAELCTPMVPFLFLHPPKEQRLGPTPAESAREGGRHPSGLPGGWSSNLPMSGWQGSRAGTTQLLTDLGSPSREVWR